MAINTLMPKSHYSWSGIVAKGWRLQALKPGTTGPGVVRFSLDNYHLVKIVVGAMMVKSSRKVWAKLYHFLTGWGEWPVSWCRAFYISNYCIGLKKTYSCATTAHASLALSDMFLSRCAAIKGLRFFSRLGSRWVWGAGAGKKDTQGITSHHNIISSYL